MIGSTLVDAAARWAVQSGPPNWLFVAALLTSPWTWSKQAKRAVRSVLGRGSSE